uniref:Uncharacterized protein n=1 Tax=Periophthalmus magnuspinnatus TaxID=409849 RepID=A0A3B4B1U9_9GOBI
MTAAAAGVLSGPTLHPWSDKCFAKLFQEKPTSKQFAGIPLLVDFSPHNIGIVRRHVHNVEENHQGPTSSLALAAVCCYNFVQIITSPFGGIVVHDHLWLPVFSCAESCIRVHCAHYKNILVSLWATVKWLLDKAKDNRRDYYQSLLVCCTTPLECGISPARLLMGRKLRSNLPIQENLLKTKEGRKVKTYKEQQKAKQKFYYDRGTQNLPELHTGDKVRLKGKTNTWTQKATVLNEIQPRSYNIQTEDGAVLRRNRHYILGPAKADQQSDEAAEQHQDPENPSSEAAVPVQEQPLRRSS